MLRHALAPSRRRPPILLARLLGVLLAGLASACARPAPEPEPYLTPLAWEARSPTHPGSVYLLGSIHVGTERMGRLHPEIESAWARAEELVVEIDLDGSGDIGRQWLQRAMLPVGKQLSDVLSPETWELLVVHLDERGVHPLTVANLKPWAVMLQLAQIQFARDGFDAAHGVDRSFLDAAAGQKTVVALESLQLQLDLYDGFPYELQERMLLDMLAPEDPVQTRALLDAWARGDEQAFLELIFPDSEGWELYRERFFFERNENMAVQLEELSRDGKTRFVVVGVGHMVGPRGIPALLSNQGFRVERIGTP